MKVFTPSPQKLHEARDLFHELLGRYTRESDWQQFFTKYPFVLSSALPLKIAPRDIVPMGRPGKTEPDFIFYPNGHVPVDYYGVIELKRPSHRIASVKRKNVALLSTDARTAVAQAEQYIQDLPGLIQKPISGGHFFLGNDRYLFVIIGMKSNELIMQPGSEIYRDMIQSELPRNLQILPYDTVLQKFENQAFDHLFMLVHQPSDDIEVLFNRIHNYKDRNLELVETVDRLLFALKPREAEIIRLYFGLEGPTRLTLKEIGEYFKLSPQRIHQIKTIALRKLR